MKTARPVTADDLFALRDDGLRRELVRGEVREMAPAGGERGATTSLINAELHAFVRRHGLGRVFAAETGFLIARDPDTVRAPDCAFVRAERLVGPVPKRFLPLEPDLAVEVVSPHDRPVDIVEKTTDWLGAGVRLVWVIDPGARTVTVHLPGVEPAVLRDGDVIEGSEVLPGFRMAVADLWP
jgi:Uma2 family endonuclease